MSVAQGMQVLDLQSQIEVLERLRLLTNFGSNFIKVTGEVGAGKTWLAQRFLEAWAEDKNQSLLMCFPNQEDEQRRLTILSQIDSRAPFDPTLSLAENLSELLQDESCNIVIVIDDAQLLSETLLSELWMLVVESQHRSNWSINIVVFALPTLLDSVMSRLCYGQEQKPIEVDIDPFPQEDADRFFEFYVMRYVEDGMERRIRNAYKKTKKIPGEIMALGEQKMEKRIVIRSIVASPKIIGLIVVILILAIGGGYYGAFYLDGGSVTDRTQHTLNGADVVQQAMQPETVSADAQALNNPNAAQQPATVSHREHSSADTKDDSQALPPDVVKQSEQVGIDEQSRKRVVISSSVVDALIQQEPTNKTAASAAPASTTISDKAIPKQTIPQPTPAPSVAINVTRSDDTTATHQDNSPFSTAALQAMSPRSYTIQLGAFRSLEEVKSFLKQHRMQQKMYVYSTTRQGENWFIVTYDNFPTIQLTRDAIEALPTSLKNLGPWAKSLQQVHREIVRVK